MTVIATTIPEAVLLEAIRASQTEPGEGLTTEELCEATGRGDKFVRRLVRIGLDNGTLRRTRRQKTSLDGRIIMTPTFAVVETK